MIGGDGDVQGLSSFLQSAVSLDIVRNRPSTVVIADAELFDGGHINLVVPSMTRGGAERCVRDVARDLEGRVRSGNLFVLGDVSAQYSLTGFETFAIVRPNASDRRSRLRQVAARILSSQSHVALTHMIRARDLREFWAMGVKTIPVIHNSEPGWHDHPTAFDHECVPEVVAVCDDVARQLRSAGLRKPLTILRHEIHSRGIKFDPASRDRIRARFGVAADTLVIGMVGQFKAHKCYVRAVRVLGELNKQVDVRLVIIGGWDHDYGAGRVAHAATMQLAEQLGVAPQLICLGSIDDVEAYYSAFDVFLNTSVYEGMSIATTEAVQAGCPIVTADVGGQREAITEVDRLVADQSDIAGYCEAILSVRDRKRGPRSPVRQPDLIPRLWGWKATFGSLPTASCASHCRTLFVTSNLNPGGAQRSLTNLLSHAVWSNKPWLCVLDRVLENEFVNQLGAHVPLLSLANAGNLVSRVGSFLSLIERVGARTICFWNTDPIFKLLVAKVLEHTPIKLVDVSPGPMLFEELLATTDMQRRIAFSAADYIGRLDVLISKYNGSLPDWAVPRHWVVIPNGVGRRPDARPIDTSLLPDGANPAFALVTCCRLAPNKRLEWLVDLMTILSVKWPEATLTIVGGVDQRHVAYFRSIAEMIAERGLTNIHFVGPRSDVFSFLPAFSQFVMVSRAQGCPNASLEAMACSLPVMANSDGGTREQVIDGVTGYNAISDDPEELARYTIQLFSDPEMRDTLGHNARQHVVENFNMSTMLEKYRAILDRGEQDGSIGLSNSHRIE